MSAVSLNGEGRVATITLTRAERRNAFDLETIAELAAAFGRAEAEAERSVVVLGAEGTVFSAGADLSAIATIEDEEERLAAFNAAAPRLSAALVAFLDQMEASRLVTVAAINGHAVGGGWLLALSCDLRVAVRGAEFWFPEPGMGRLPTPRVDERLLESVGPPVAKEILMLGRRRGAEELMRMGLLNAVVDADQLEAEIAALTAGLAGIEPAVLSGLKKRLTPAGGEAK